ncbi:MAG: arginyltransferase [Alphaproteobacteria bacterium]|nr:arginyltransferase [Alphaproteobacteria bacterium]
MSVIPPSLNRDLRFYLSGPAPCPYLPAQIERKLFTRLSGDAAADKEINAALCRAGFRRSHDIVYRPACSACNACIPVRVPVRLLHLSRSQKRTAARNRDLVLTRIAPEPTDELSDLFFAYQRTRHGDSDMARMTRDDFDAMLREGQADTHLYLLRDEAGALKGCMIADSVGDGLSALYSFFDPEEPKRSLGTQLILSLVDAAQERALPFVYLGYWIAQSRKMAYKSHFRPLQYLGPHGWDWLETEA